MSDPAAERTVPVFVDALRVVSGERLVRCGFFAVNVIGGSFAARLPGLEDALAVVGLSAVLCRPACGERFTSAAELDALLEQIEAAPERVVEVEHLFLPARLFGRPPASGEVYRVGLALFGVALRGRRDRLSARELWARTRALGAELRRSPEESRVFAAWFERALEGARASYGRMRAEGRALSWLDETTGALPG